MKNLFVLVKKFSLLGNYKIQDKLLLIEALFYTGVARLAMVSTSFKILRKLMGEYNKNKVSELSQQEHILIFKVKWAVLLVSKYTPWKSECLVQALAAQRMLKKRNVNSTIHLGVGKDMHSNILAHAWLKCGGITVTGESKEGFFKEVAKFS